MIREEEKQFREAERRLDELLRGGEAEIAARGVEITDESVRRYGHWREYLSWDYWFVTRRPRGCEFEKVTVTVSLYEHDAASLRVRSRAEIFQLGKQSRWQSTTEELLSLEEAGRRGLSSVVLGAIGAGEAALADVT